MIKTDLLVVGAGPAGMAASISAAKNGINVILLEENERVGGQLIKQTHRFFGSQKEHAGIRGIHIAEDLKKEIESYKNIELMLSATLMGIYEDGIFTVLKDDKMIKIKPEKTIMATGAFEKYLLFENNDLPGIYGAGAVQTLMNINGVLPAKKVLMIGSGNIGLIVSYQLMQAGVEIAGVIEASNKIGGYMVHAAKLKRLGVPIYTSHTIEKAIGNERVEGALLHKLDSNWNKIEGSEFEIDCDCICLAVGLSPLTDILFQSGCAVKYLPELGGYVPYRDEHLETSIKGLYVAGDVSGIEEATGAMVEGEIAGLHVAGTLKQDDKIFERIKEMKEELRSLRAGPVGHKIREGLSKLYDEIYVEEDEFPEVYDIEFFRKTGTPSEENLKAVMPDEERLNKGPVAVTECFQRIPCDPCVYSCPYNAIKPFEDMNELPEVIFEKCIGCGICVGKCPGLAIFVLNKNYSETTSTVTLPYEFLPKPAKESIVDVLDRSGAKICEGKIIRILDGKAQDKTSIVTVEVPKEFYNQARNIKVVL
jgi:thioredoxin reductase/Fe-S-cluster-containing hydrogenase component 2